MANVKRVLKINIGIERLFWFLISFVVFIHFCACGWGFLGRFMLLEDSSNWIMVTNR